MCHCVWQCFSGRFVSPLLGGVDLVSSLEPHLDLIIMAVFKASADYYSLPDCLLPSSTPWILTHLLPAAFHNLVGGLLAKPPPQTPVSFSPACLSDNTLGLLKSDPILNPHLDRHCLVLPLVTRFHLQPKFLSSGSQSA